MDADSKRRYITIFVILQGSRYGAGTQASLAHQWFYCITTRNYMARRSLSGTKQYFGEEHIHPIVIVMMLLASHASSNVHWGVSDKYYYSEFCNSQSTAHANADDHTSLVACCRWSYWCHLQVSYKEKMDNNMMMVVVVVDSDHVQTDFFLHIIIHYLSSGEHCCRVLHNDGKNILLLLLMDSSCGQQ